MIDTIWNFFYPYLLYVEITMAIVLIVLAFLAGLSKSGNGVGKKIYAFLVAVFTFIQEALKENGGGPSSKRLMNFYATVILVPGIFYVLVHMAKYHPELAYQYFLTTLGFIAAMFGIQIYGKKDEIKDPNNLTAPDDKNKV